MSDKILRQSFSTLLKDYALVTLGVVSYALGWSVFLLPNNLVGGGVSGFASILLYATGIPMGVTYFVLNIILLIIGTKILGTGFGGKTIYAIIMTSVMLSVMPKIIPADFIHEFAVSNGKLICTILGGIIAGQHEADIVLGQQDVAALGVHIRLVIAHPQDLRKGEAGQGGIGGDGDQLFLADLLVDLVALLGGTLVAPDDGGTQDFVVLIQHDQAVHLAGNAQGDHVILAHAGLGQHRLNGGHSSVPPILGFLLSPAVMGLVHGIFHSGRGHRHAILVKQHRLGAGSSKVNTKNVFHQEQLLSICLNGQKTIYYNTWKCSIRQ